MKTELDPIYQKTYYCQQNTAVIVITLACLKAVHLQKREWDEMFTYFPTRAITT